MHNKNNHNLTTMGFFEKYLTAWVVLCIIIGVALGDVLPGLFYGISRMEIARVKFTSWSINLDYDYSYVAKNRFFSIT